MPQSSHTLPRRPPQAFSAYLGYIDQSERRTASSSEPFKAFKFRPLFNQASPPKPYIATMGFDSLADSKKQKYSKHHIREVRLQFECYDSFIDLISSLQTAKQMSTACLQVSAIENKNDVYNEAVFCNHCEFQNSGSTSDSPTGKIQ